jgi:hypothetical protein
LTFFIVSHTRELNCSAWRSPALPEEAFQRRDKFPPLCCRASNHDGAGHLALPVFVGSFKIGSHRTRNSIPGSSEKELPEQKISRVLFSRQRRDDDHLSGSFVAKGFKRPTRRLSPACGGRGGQPLTSILGLALRRGLPGPVLPRERVVSYTTFSPLPFDPARGGTSRRYVFCGTFRPLRAHELRGALPWRVRTFLPSIPPSAGLIGRSSILLWQH